LGGCYIFGLIILAFPDGWIGNKGVRLGPQYAGRGTGGFRTEGGVDALCGLRRVGKWGGGKRNEILKHKRFPKF